SDERGVTVWARLASVRGDADGQGACIELSQGQLDLAQAGLEEGDPWLRADGMARSGQGRTNRVHHTSPVYLVDEASQPDDPEEGASAILGPEGGQVTLLDSDGETRAVLIIPEGALLEETTIGISPEADPELGDGSFAVPGTSVFLSPSGLEFATPVALVLVFDPGTLPLDTDPDELEIHRLDADGSTTPQPTVIEVGESTATATLSSFSGYVLLDPPPSIIDQVSLWSGGASPDPRDWHDPANWVGTGRVPDQFTPALILADVEHFPRITSPADVGDLTIREGASLEMVGSGITVHGSIISEGTFTSDGGATVIMFGEGTRGLRGNVPNLGINAERVLLSGDVDVEGRLLLAGAGPLTLEIGAHVMEISGDLITFGTDPARLLMTESIGRVIVHGNASFSTPWPGDPPLRAGTLELRGNFVQTTYPDAFRAGGNHRTLFSGGGGIQTVMFNHVSGTSHFSRFELGDTEEVMLLSDIHAQSLSWADEGLGARLSGGVTVDAESALLRGPITVDELRVGRSLLWMGEPYLVSRTVFRAATVLPDLPQKMQTMPYQDVIVDGGDVELGDEFVTVQGNFRIRDGQFRTGSGNVLTVNNHFRTEGEGLLQMVSGDRIVVNGGFEHLGKAPSEGHSGGTLWVAGDFNSGPGGLFGSPSHTTVFFGSEAQRLFGGGVLGNIVSMNSEDGLRIESTAPHGFAEEPTRLIDMIGYTRIADNRRVSVGNIVFRAGSRTHSEPGALLNCHLVWGDKDAVITSDASEVGCYRFAGVGAEDERPELRTYTPPTPLLATITSPPSGTRIEEGESVTFQARARMDGAEVAATFSWASGFDGDLGTGASLVVNSLSVGVHLIWLMAETPDGLVARDWITVQVVAPEQGMPASAVTTGRNHSCALDSDGRAWCWGANGGGAVGDGTTEERGTPVPVASSARFSAIDAGFATTCAVALSGEAFCWGRDGGTPSTSPLAVSTDVRFVEVAVGGFHVCGIATDGRMYCWGRSNEGQLGLGEGQGSTVPALVSEDLVFVALAVGDFHSCGITADGNARCWGLNDSGQVGAGISDHAAWTPTLVSGEGRYVDIATGERHTCAVTEDGLG
ncbi:MAG: hypothetical protein EA351_09485, partial [Gemmatimonadales bacterium]